MKILGKSLAVLSVLALCGGVYYYNSSYAKHDGDNKAAIVETKNKNDKHAMAKAEADPNKPLVAKVEGSDANKPLEAKVETPQEAKKENSAILPSDYRKGNEYLKKYSAVQEVKHVILVERSDKELSVATLYLLAKDAENNWKEVFNCEAFLGKNGIHKTREGDMCTPTGDFGVTMAFGIKDDPGSIVPYTKLTNTMYVCGDREYYNKFVDTTKVNHQCGNNSEHLIKYSPTYNYSLFMDYNKEGEFGKGSAIFLHCKGNYRYTLGCISVDEARMVEILKTVDQNVRICVYPKE